MVAEFLPSDIARESGVEVRHVGLLACREAMLVELNVLSYDALAQAGNPEEESAVLVLFA